jgi:poly-beta-1,6-N-acetyl-D-glucosamine synthase
LWLLAIAGIASISIVIAVYASYFAFILRKKDLIGNYLKLITKFQEKNSATDLEKVSIIVSAYNEENIIGRKINNIAELNYPMQNLEIIILDDSSIDRTAQVAESKLKEKKLDGKVIRNSKRIGLNKSLNAAVTQTKNDFVCVTDSDVLLEKDALLNSVRVLQCFDDVGGVTGRIQPVFEGEGVAQTSESTYRGFYHNSMLAESSIHSAFPGNGPLIVYNKLKVPEPIPDEYGSTDGNIAINVIKQGLRFLYVPNAIVYEPSPENLKQHRLQKIRRAKRLLQVFIRNRNISLDKKYGEFGKRVFPLKLLMFSVCPFLLFIGLLLISAFIVIFNSIGLYALLGTLLFFAFTLSFANKRFGSLFSSFILHQFYLFIGLFSSFGKTIYWKTIERKTNLKID